MKLINRVEMNRMEWLARRHPKMFVPEYRRGNTFILVLPSAFRQSGNRQTYMERHVLYPVPPRSYAATSR